MRIGEEEEGKQADKASSVGRRTNADGAASKMTATVVPVESRVSAWGCECPGLTARAACCDWQAVHQKHGVPEMRYSAVTSEQPYSERIASYCTPRTHYGTTKPVHAP